MPDYWSWHNAVDGDGTTINSLSGSAGDLGVINIRDPRVAKPWRAGAMPAELRVGLPASAGVSIIGLFGTNLSQVGTLTIGLGTADGASNLWEGQILTGGFATSRQAVVVLRDTEGELSPVNAGHVTIKASGTVPIEIGRLWVGTADWTPRVGHTMQSSRRVTDLSSVSRTPRAGARLVDRAGRLRTFTAAYDALQPEEYDEVLHQIDVERGLAAQMLFIPNPDVYSLDRAPILGGLVELSETAFVGYLRGARSLTIQEDG